ncbi:MAG: hypothetical protein DVB31_02930 [Verrucomicrobia bacterium]|nr:MAG: hypothetical protein DVB31_02930 [Verrucomicrobiota bacterium]
MSRPTFDESDLQISQEFLDEVRAALGNAGNEQPIKTVLDECAGVVADYTARYELESSRWRRLVRALALEALHALLNAVPDGIKVAADKARRELEDIRDGKFVTLKKADNPTIAIQPVRGDWGSDARIKPRIGSP